ncbi:MAG: hydrolase, partial [Pseudarthrobacter sp.]|nr:hydrolase [Pseudarthrobacter sp.]
MSTPKTPVASAGPAEAGTAAGAHAEPDVQAEAFAAAYSVRPVPAAGPVDTTAICTTPAALEELDALWKAVVHETRTRGNDIHLPISLAYAERLCRAYPDA